MATVRGNRKQNEQNASFNIGCTSKIDEEFEKSQFFAQIDVRNFDLSGVDFFNALECSLMQQISVATSFYRDEVNSAADREEMAKDIINVLVENVHEWLNES